MKPTRESRLAPQVRCAIYTRKSTNKGLDQEFNSLDAQREAAESYIASQKAEGWICLPDRYDDGGFTGANMERPALKQLMADIRAGRVDCVVVYKVDRLSRSLMDFARMMEAFESLNISFVSVTQQFNTTHSLGRLTLNILLSFAQFEREIISERTRDKIAAARRKGKWAGGRPILGYDIDPINRKLLVNVKEAERVRAIFAMYLEHQSAIRTAAELNARGWRTKQWKTRRGDERGGQRFAKNNVISLLNNVLYVGKVRHKDDLFEGEHDAIIDSDTWEKAQRTLRVNGRTGGAHIRNKHGALLKGLLFCGPCRHAMSHTYTVRDGKCCYRYYVCYTAQKEGWTACPSKSIPAEQIEQFVVERIRAIARDPELIAMTLDQSRRHTQECLAAREADLAVTERGLQRIRREIRRAAGDAADRHASARLADLNEELRTNEQRHAELSTEIANLQRDMVSREEVEAGLSRFDPLWESLSPGEQSRVIQLLIKRVEYDGKNSKVSIAFHTTGLRALSDMSGHPEETAA